MSKPGCYLLSLVAAFALLAPAMLSVLPLSGNAAALSDPASPTLWLKYSGNPILGPGAPGSFDSNLIWSSSVLRSDGKYLLYYSGEAGSGFKVGLATSSDGRQFTRYAGNPIITKGANPTVIRDGQDFKMWYIGDDGIRIATSDDGRLWSDYPYNPVLENAPEGAWDVDYKEVCIIRDGDVYKMWYSGRDVSGYRIGYATSSDGLAWAKYSENPVLAGEYSWETAGVHACSVIRVSDEYQMWYSASTAQSTRLCYANSTDGVHWLKYPGNPLMPASAQWESLNKQNPAVLFDGRDYRMWYTGTDANLRTQIGCADSTGTGPYAPVPLSPADLGWSNLSSPAFAWSFGSPGNGQSAFRFQLDDSLDFGSTQVDTGDVPSSSPAFNLSEELPDGTYYWRVQATDEAGDLSAWSAVRTLRIDSTSPVIRALTIDGGAPFSVNRTAEIALNASDPVPGSGLAGMRYSVNGGEWTSWEPYRERFTADLSGPDRIWKITIEVRDGVYNSAPAANASILVDRTAPSAPVLAVNGGAAYTNSLAVQLSMSSVDPSPGTGPADMAFSNDGAVWTSWEPFGPSKTYNLSGGDGPKAVQARVRDRAGNIGATSNASIILDTTPPATSLLRIPAISEETNFTVSWVGLDALSGVAGFELEYRENGGAWTAWLNGTNGTQAIFSGRDGSTYSFRARALDRIGNLEPFPSNATLSVRVELPQPSVAILDPPPQKVIKGRYLFGGTSSHPKPGRAVTLVEVSVDNGPWARAEGTLSWTYTLDTAKLKNGMHNVTARSFDGTKYSETAVTPFRISNEASSPSLDLLPVLLLVLIIVVAGASASIYVLRSRGPKGPVAPPKPPPPDPD